VSPEPADAISEHVRWAVATWPQIDPLAEGIVSRIDKANRYILRGFRDALGQAGLTKEEWKVLMALHDATRSHGWLCRELDVSTGAMTNRLDKLEEQGLVRRDRDPADRRGVLLVLTEEGRSRLEDYINAGSGRDRELLADLTESDKRTLDRLLAKLLASLERRGAGLA
jgi:DNA-binding MarR family transcriptional regulator